MRFKKGDKIEVLTKDEFPTGAWRCAEIISGNGHTYGVKYGWFPVTGEGTAALERVPRRTIRPCPPPVNGSHHDWVSGDVVEVFDDLCWKPAVVVRVFGANNFSVRFLGSSNEFDVHKSRMRFRQSWEDGNWFLIGKGLSNQNGLPTRKRSMLGLLDDDGHKKRAIEKGSIGGQRIIVRFPSPASEKVDAFVSLYNRVGDRYMPLDTISCISSVGSCSGLGNDGINLSPVSVTKDCVNLEDYCSDADSYCEQRCGDGGSSPSTNVELGTDFHRAELYTYQQALGALHASGSFTWEEEVKVTNLRRDLNITNDEHLRELRKLRHDDSGFRISCF